MRYDYLQSFDETGRMAMGDWNSPLFFVHVFRSAIPSGQARHFLNNEPKRVLEWTFARHNDHGNGVDGDNRPRGQEIRSMSVGDVVVITSGDDADGFKPDDAVERSVWVCANMGWEQVAADSEAAKALIDAADRKAYTRPVDLLPAL